MYFLSFAGINDAPAGFILAIALILWVTILFANFAEAIAEGRGRAQADSLKSARKEVMDKKVKYFLICGLILSVLSVINNYYLVKSKLSADKKWKEAVENAKAYSELFSNSENKNRAFKLTLDQLKNSNDSIFQELNATRKELKVKKYDATLSVPGITCCMEKMLRVANKL